MPDVPRSAALAWFDRYRNWLAAAIAGTQSIIYFVERFRHGLVAPTSAALVFMVSWLVLAAVGSVAAAIWEARLEEPKDGV